MHNEMDRIDRTRKRDKVDTVAQCLNQVKGIRGGAITDDNQIDTLAKLVIRLYLILYFRFLVSLNTCL